MKIGILGTGDIGGALALLLTRAGHDVIVGSRHPSQRNRLAHDLSQVGQGRVESEENAMAHGNVLIDALPFHASMALDPELLHDKLIVTAANYYPGRDGDIDLGGRSESEAFARRLKGARVAKAFNIIHAKVFRDNFSAPPGSGERLGVLYAVDDHDDHPADVETIETLIADAGFDPVRTGGLSTGFAFQPDTPAYGAGWTAAELRERLRL